MKNKVQDLRDHLFAQLDRLSDENLTQEQLDVELNRSYAITDVAQTIINSAKVEVDFIKATNRKEAPTEIFETKKALTK